MRLGVGVVDTEADDARRGDPDDGRVEFVPGVAGVFDAMSSTTNATFGLTATFRYF
jgi:hypothetical protein